MLQKNPKNLALVSDSLHFCPEDLLYFCSGEAKILMRASERVRRSIISVWPLQNFHYTFREDLYLSRRERGDVSKSSFSFDRGKKRGKVDGACVRIRNDKEERNPLQEKCSEPLVKKSEWPEIKALKEIALQFTVVFPGQSLRKLATPC